MKGWKMEEGGWKLLFRLLHLNNIFNFYKAPLKNSKKEKDLKLSFYL